MDIRPATKSPLLRALAPLAWLAALPLSADAGDGVTFRDIAADPGSGIDYVRVPTPELVENVEFWYQQSLVSPLPMPTIAATASRPYGMPGLALFDYDRDGCLDIYVTNGPGAANSLFRQLPADRDDDDDSDSDSDRDDRSHRGARSHDDRSHHDDDRSHDDRSHDDRDPHDRAPACSLTFEDVAHTAGVEAIEQTSSGTCYGDIDNDGDDDLFVMGLADDNKLFVNNGDGTFTEAPGSGIEGDGDASGSCTVADVDNDGLLDLVVANNHDPAAQFACFAVPFAENEHNRLYINQGDGTFADEGAARGIEDQMIPGQGFQPGITWTTGAADIDLDGDIDIIFGDDQCGFPHAGMGGIDRGFVHVMLNDGTGHFTDDPITYNGNRPAGQNKGVGYMMGTAFGDLDCDGNMDLFMSNVGDYAFPIMGMPYQTGDASTRWFLGDGAGRFSDPGVGALRATPFGWGNAILDYDNDGDQDLLSLGGLDIFYFLWKDNPGALLENDGCSASFDYDSGALSGDYTVRNIQGVAVGDLNRDGAVDVVTTTNWNAPAAGPFLPSPNDDNGSPFDATAVFVPVFTGDPVNGFVWTGTTPQPADIGLTIEINSGGRNGAVSFTPVGTVGVARGGGVNRSGIGAVVSFTPDGGRTVMSPVVGGSSFLSQHSLDAHFGLGTAQRGTVEVLWPGGIRNRLDRVRSGERLVLPEIPCTIEASAWTSRRDFVQCVTDALDDIESAGIIDEGEGRRLLDGMKRAFDTP